jgi:hypothetical protein
VLIFQFITRENSAVGFGSSIATTYVYKWVRCAHGR